MEALEQRQMLSISATDNAFTALYQTALSGIVGTNDLPDPASTSADAFLLSRPTNGSLGSSFASSGAFTYTPNTAYVGNDSFNYLLVDAVQQTSIAPTTPDAQTSDAFGNAVAISGKFAVVGTMWDDERGTDAGAAYVYRWDGSAWGSPQKLLPHATVGAYDPAYGQFGYQVAIDGNRILVGAWLDNAGGGGAADVGSVTYFEFDGVSWVERQKLEGTAAGDSFGRSVALSGNTALMGAPYYGAANNGAVYAYSLDQTSFLWGSTPQIITAADGAAGDYFGTSVAIDGTLAVIGAVGDDNTNPANPLQTFADTGSAYAFRNNGSTWFQQGAKMLASDRATSDEFGWAVDVSGERVVVGARYADLGGTSNTGAAYIYERSGGNATEIKLAPAGLAADSGFGWAVGIEGETVVVGAYLADAAPLTDTGATFVYQKLAGSWSQTQKLITNIGQSNVGGGYGVASIDGDIIASGQPFADVGGVVNAGSVAFYQLQQDIGTVSIRVLPSGATIAATDDNFAVLEDAGSATGNVLANDLGTGLTAYLARKPENGTVSLAGGGSYSYTPTANYVGTDAFTYTLNQLTERRKSGAAFSAIDANSVEATARFGFSVALDGDVAVIGAPYEDNGTAADQGAIYIMRWNGSDWVAEQKVWGDAAGDLFGYDVAISKGRIVVGAFQADDGAYTAGGAAYVFEHDGKQWPDIAHAAKLTRPGDPAGSYWFGLTVAISGDNIVVGAPLDASVATNAGSAYVFHWTGSDWGNGVQLSGTSMGQSAYDQFGQSVAIDGDQIVVGAINDATSATGAIYVFKSVSGIWSPQVRKVGSGLVSGDQFGWSVDISGNTIAVGARYRDVSTVDQAGAVYLFEGAGATWTELTPLVLASPGAQDFFGFDVALEGDTLVVGAYQDDSSGSDNAGAVHIYRYDTGSSTWTLRHSQFSGVNVGLGGYGVGAVWGDMVLMGIPYDSTSQASAGSVAFYEFQNASVLVNVLSANNDQPAKVGTIPNLAVSEDAQDFVVPLDKYFTDADQAAGDTLSYAVTLSGANPGMLGYKVVGNALTLEFKDDLSGTATVSVTATDAGGLSSAASSFNVTVGAVDDAPRIGGLAPTASVSSASSALFKDSPISLKASGVSDPDGTVTQVEFYWDQNNNGVRDSGDYSLGTGSSSSGWSVSSTMPSNMPLGPATFFAVPRYINGSTIVEGRTAISTQEINSSTPVLDPIGAKKATANQRLLIKPTGFDPDASAGVTFSASGLPSGATFTNGIFDWTPTNSQVGSYTVTFKAEQTGSPSIYDSESVGIVVSASQHKPYFVDTTAAKVDTHVGPDKHTIAHHTPDGGGSGGSLPVDFTINFTDDDSTPTSLSMSLSNSSLPSGLTLSVVPGTGVTGARIHGTLTAPPPLADPLAPQSFPFTLTVSDGTNSVDEQFYFGYQGWAYQGSNTIGSSVAGLAADDFAQASATDAVLIDVLTNDFGAGLDTISNAGATIKVGSSATGATISVVNEGGLKIKYEPKFGNAREDQFTYSVTTAATGWTPSSYTTNTATVRVKLVEEDQAFTTLVCDCDCGCLVTSWEAEPSSGAVLAKQVVGRAGALGDLTARYNSAVDGLTLIGADFAVGEGNQPRVPDDLSATVHFNDLEGTPVGSAYYSTAGLDPQGRYRLAFLVDAGAFATGHYPYKIELDADGQQTDFIGSVNVVNRSDSEFGKGWSLRGLDRLYPSTSGALLVTGDNASFWFPKVGSAYAQAQNDPQSSQLSGSASVGYTLTHKDGSTDFFSQGTANEAAGMLTQRSDRLGNVTSYKYADYGDADSLKTEIASITDYTGQVVSFAYGTEGRVASITGTDGQTTTFAQVSGDATRLGSITMPDPDAGGSGLPAVVSFSYDSTSSRIARIETKVGSEVEEQVNFSYDPAAHRLQRVTGINGSLIQFLQPSQLTNLVGFGGTGLGAVLPGFGTFATPLPLMPISGTAAQRGRVSDALGNVTEFVSDRLGQPLSMTDPLGNTTTWGRNAVGLPLTMTEPDPDGPNNPLTAPVTTYGYDGRFNLLSLTKPDGSQNTWTYDSNYNQVQSFVENVGASSQTTLFDLYGTGSLARGNVQYMRQIVGAVDGSPLTGDDLVTTFTYTTAGTNQPAGLVDTVVDPLGRITDYDYYTTATDAGRLQRVTTGVHSADVAATQFEYYASGLGKGQVKKVTDPLGRVTEFEYDALGNQTLVREVGFGTAGTGPTTQYVYDHGHELAATIDQLGRSTLYEYNRYHQLERLVQPDPDGGGPLTSPETLYLYNAAGQLAAVIDPLHRKTSYLYDSAGRLTQTTEPDPDGSASAYSSPITTYTYDNLGRLKTVTQPDPDGSGTGLPAPVTQYEYNSLALLTKVTAPDPDGSTPTLSSPITQYGYDSFGRVQTTTDPLGNVTSYEYDPVGRLKKLSQPYPDTVGKTIDDGDAVGYSTTGTWTPQTGGQGNDYRVAAAGSNSTAKYQFTGLDPNKKYEVLASWVALTANSQVAPYTVYDGTDTGGAAFPTVQINQQNPPTHTVLGAGWATLGIFALTQGTLTVKLANAPTGQGQVIADSIKVIEARSETSYGYDEAGNTTSVTDAAGNPTRYSYDAQNRLVTQSLPYPAEKRIDDGDASPAYSTSGTWTTSTAAGQGGDYQYAPAYTSPGTDRAATWKFTGLDPTKQYEVVVSWVASGSNATNAPYQVWDGDGSGTAFPTINRNQQVAGNHPILGAGWDTLGTFSLTQDKLTVKLNNVGATANVVADMVRVLEVRPETRYEYDRAGQLVEQVDPLGRVTRYQYDYAGRQLAMLSADPDFDGPDLAPVTSYVYDAAGQLLATRDRLGQTTVNTYDLLGRMIGQTDPNGATTKYAYDLVGNRTQLTDPLGNDTVWAYDGLNRVSTETNELNKVRTYFYDGLSRPRRREDRVASSVPRATEYTYDNLDRLTQERWYNTAGGLDRTLNYGYDAASRLTSASDPTATYAFTPDGLGRTVTTVATITGLSSSVTLDAAYDSRGNRTQAAFKIGATADFKNTYAYDPLSRLTQLVQQGSGGNTVNAKRVDFAYDAGGQLQKLSRYSDTAGTQFVASSGYTFDRLGRLVNLSHQKTTSEVAGYRMAYDAAGRLVRLDSSVDEVSQFNYDKRGQLTAAENTFEQDEAYAYDANGNRTGDSIVVQANNRLTSDATYTYTYDDEGNRTSRTHKGSGDKQDYTWDQRNRLVEVKFSNGAGMVAKKVRYDYDVFDRLVSRTEDSAYPFDYAGAPAELFVYDGDDVALDFLDADGVGTGAGATLQKRYLHGPAVDQVLAQEDVLVSDADRVLWHLADNLGSTRDVLRSDGTTKAHLQYDSFGNLIDGLESVTRYQFTGREHDPDTGLQFNRRRWYDPPSAQWMSEDPIGFSAGDANLRRYVGNGPTNATDPSGKVVQEIHFQRPDHYLDELNQAIKDAPTGPERERLEAERDRYLKSKKFWGDMQMGMELSGFIGVIYTGPTVLGRMLGWCRGVMGFTDDAARLGGGAGKLPGAGGHLAAPTPPAKPPVPTPPVKGPAKPPGNFIPIANPPQAPPAIPPHFESVPARGPGTVYRPPGTTGDANTIRIMRPNKTYPDGYWVRCNESGQPLNPATGGTGHRGQTHVPLPPGWWDDPNLGGLVPY